MIVLVHLALLHMIHASYPYYGKLIQDGWGTGATNGLDGSIFAIDEKTMQVIGFSFDPPVNDTG